MVTVTSIGEMVMYPSVTSKVTLVKFGLVLVKRLARKPIMLVPASVLAAAAVPLKVKSWSTSYRSLLAVAV